jgi:hypothetical protein
VLFRTMRLLGGLTILFLVACGGGGGGGGAGAGAGGVGNPIGANPTQVESAMIPAAPSVGAILFEDAAVLRPIKLGFKWGYSGERRESADATPSKYLLTTTFVAGGSTGIVSTDVVSDGTISTPFDLSVTAGVVKQVTTVDLVGTGTPEPIPLIELRSPVRQNDQFVSFQRKYATSVVDADRDGKPDALEVAVYGRVIGIENLDFPNLPTMKALRVDTWILVRATFSSTGQVTPVAESKHIQAWYVEGIGLVRQLSTTPIGKIAKTDDMKLTYWDGMDAGIGAMPPVDAIIPTNAAQSAGKHFPLLGFSGATATFEDHALLFSPTSNYRETLSARIDKRGNILSTTLLPIGTAATSVPFKEGVIFLEGITDKLDSLNITKISSLGALVNSNIPTVLNLAGAREYSQVTKYAASIDAATLWVLWERYYYYYLPDRQVFGTELILRPFALNGTPVGPEILVEPTAVASPAIAAASGKVLLTWIRDPQKSGKTGFESMYASATVSGLNTITTLSNAQDAVTPIRMGTESALLWGASLQGYPKAGVASGVLLDGNTQPVQVGTSELDYQIAAFPRLGQVSANGTRLATHGYIPNPTNSTDISMMMVSWLDINGAPLSKTPTNSIRFAMQSSFPDARNLLFSDRMLILHGGGALQTTIVWLNKGPR